MNRQEFDKKTRVAILMRSMVDGRPRCEFVDAAKYPFVRCICAKKLEVHHVRMDALVADDDKVKRKLTIEDGIVLCKDHHKDETDIQVRDLAKAMSVRARALGADKPKRGFAKVSKEKPPLRVANGISNIARRYGIEP